MAHYEHLPIYKSALDLCIYFEKVVRHFDRHHKYVIGADLRRLGIKAVMLVIQANDARYKTPHLEDWKEEIRRFLKQRLDLDIHKKKTVIRPVSCGIDYLGYVVRPFYILVRRRVVNHLKQKLAAGVLGIDSLMSYLGHFKHADAYNLTKKITQKWRAA